MTGQKGSLIRIKFGYVIAAFVAIALVLVIVNAVQTQPDEGVASTPVPTSTAMTDPSETLVNEDDPPPDLSGLSSISQPTKVQVWQFETAFNTPDPETKVELLLGVATGQYVDAHRDGFTKPSDIDVKIDENRSTMTIAVDQTRTSSYVETRVLLAVSEGGVTRTVTLAPHGSYWVNTPVGWKVTKDIEAH